MRIKSTLLALALAGISTASAADSSFNCRSLTRQQAQRYINFLVDNSDAQFRLKIDPAQSMKLMANDFIKKERNLDPNYQLNVAMNSVQRPIGHYDFSVPYKRFGDLYLNMVFNRIYNDFVIVGIVKESVAGYQTCSVGIYIKTY